MQWTARRYGTKHTTVHSYHSIYGCRGSVMSTPSEYPPLPLTNPSCAPPRRDWYRRSRCCSVRPLQRTSPMLLVPAALPPRSRCESLTTGCRV
eukprot:9095137-Pyramimonas_sp.AAC.1